MVLILFATLFDALSAWGSHATAAGISPSFQVSLQESADDSVPPRAPESKTYVYDKAGVLAEAEAERHQFDLDRLWHAGIPTVIYIRRSDDSRREAVAFADRVREKWALESSPGADDGIVLLVSLNNAEPVKNSLVLSTGLHALPINQLTSDTLREIQDTEVQPAFRRNEINLALSFGVRRILYFEGYTPPDPPPLTDRQLTARAIAPSAMLLAGAIALLGPLVQRGRAAPTRRRSRGVYLATIAVLLTLSAGLALYGRTAPWLAVAALGGMAVALGIRFASAWGDWHRAEKAVIRVPSRGRRSRVPTVHAHRPSRGIRHV